MPGEPLTDGVLCTGHEEVGAYFDDMLDTGIGTGIMGREADALGAGTGMLPLHTGEVCIGTGIIGALLDPERVRIGTGMMIGIPFESVDIGRPEVGAVPGMEDPEAVMKGVPEMPKGELWSPVESVTTDEKLITTVVGMKDITVVTAKEPEGVGPDPAELDGTSEPWLPVG